MKLLTTFLAVTALILFLGYNNSAVEKNQTVNPLLGDISFENKFGQKPIATTDNDLRIKTHLEYVENLLREKDVSELSVELQIKRNFLLDQLHEYLSAGIFPKNYDYADLRKPCFIDKEGNICAVGYLVEKTSSKAVAENINNKFKYEDLLAMNDEIINDWILSSGLTKKECAMIQPTYGPVPVLSYNHITPEYGISSSILSGLNLSLSAVNGIQISKGGNKTVPYIGLVTGAGQVVLGSLMFTKQQESLFGVNYTNENQNALSMVNIGLGTTTMILSAWNLITNCKPRNRTTSWNIYSFPAQDNNAGLAFSLTKKF